MLVRPYRHREDFERVNRFLVHTYRTKGEHINWIQPRWEYMHYHPLIREIELNAIGVWEKAGKIVGVVHPEHAMGTAYFEIAPDVDTDPVAFRQAMLRHAEKHISTTKDGVRQLRVFIHDEDEAFQDLAASAGYRKGNWREPMTRFEIPDPFPPIKLPDGFRLKSLADENDLLKVEWVLWRGFNHKGDPPEDWLDDKRLMQSAPNYRKEHNIVVEAPDGRFVSYCGMWMEPVHATAYVEPVATDPDFRRMGLASAAVLEGIRRCGAAGATLAWVATDMPFYLSLGFERVYSSSMWQREWAST